MLALAQDEAKSFGYEVSSGMPVMSSQNPFDVRESMTLKKH